jgi:hypothetical protein
MRKAPASDSRLTKYFSCSWVVDSHHDVPDSVVPVGALTVE